MLLGPGLAGGPATGSAVRQAKRVTVTHFRHGQLADAGLEPGPIAKPFYNPDGEFRLVDPDAHVGR
jgi:hypothetical protein